MSLLNHGVILLKGVAVPSAGTILRTRTIMKKSNTNKFEACPASLIVVQVLEHIF